MAKEVVTVHLGQAGCSIGKNVWELLCQEHEIQPDGKKADSGGMAPAGDEEETPTYQSFFFETASGQHVPRTVMLDTDPSLKDDIATGEYKDLFHPDSIICYKEDCKSNFFEGRRVSREMKITEMTMDRVRKTVDMCDNLQGFFVFRSFAGGTGAGIGTEVLEQLRNQFGKKMIFEPAIYPSRDYANCIVEPYNCLLATGMSTDLCDLTMVLDNQAAYRICRNQLKVKDPSFVHLNRLIAQMVSGCTTSLRFESELGASLTEIVGNVVPRPAFRYPLVSMSPIRDPKIAMHESFSTKEIVTDLFEPKNILGDVGPHFKTNRLLAAVLLLRGQQDAPMEPGEDGRSASGMSNRTAGGTRKVPMAPKDAMAAVEELVAPKQSHRQPLKFLPWLESGGFKVGVVGQPPSIPGSKDDQGRRIPFMAESERQGTCLLNSTAVRTIFSEQYKKFLSLFYQKSYIWQFIDASGELDTFYECKEAVRSLIDSYEDILKDCCVNPGDEIKGGTSREK